MIALWGVRTDRPLAAVRRALVRLGRPAVILDQLASGDADVEVSLAGDSLSGSWSAGGEVLHLSDIRAWYARPYDPATVLRACGLATDDPRAARLAHAQEGLTVWCGVTDALVVNSLEAMSLNGSKPHQLRYVAAAGFRVPRTLATNDPERALAFLRDQGRVIYKSVSSVRSRVAELTPAHLERLANLRWCPVQLQEWIPGHDVRVHIVGEEVHATAIHTTATDYRYPGPGEEPDLEATRLPADIEERCRAMARSMQLPFAGIDLRRTPGGEWYCFEVNPSPGFTYYESATGQPIAAAVARLLASA